MKRIIFITITAILTISIPFGFCQGTKQITLRTYFPEPIGAYSRIQLIPKSALNNPCEMGELLSLDDATQNNKIFLYGCYDDGADSTENKILQGAWSYDIDGNGNQLVYLSNTANYANLKVGIGTSSPIFKLTLDDWDDPSNPNKGILALDYFADENTLSPPSGENIDMGNGDDLLTTGSGTRFIWHPKKVALRAGGVTGDAWDNNNIGLYSVAFGLDSRSANHSGIILGGQNNQSTVGSDTTIVGGRNNLIETTTTSSGTIAGGQNNHISETWSGFIGGGIDNHLHNSASSVIVGGGFATPFDSTDNNVIGSTILPADYSAIGGGASNSIAKKYGVIVGGLNNTISGEYAAIGGGENNEAAGDYSFIGGGINNYAGNSNINYHYNIVVGGSANRIGRNRSGTVSNSFGAILGGEDNNITGQATSAIIGGETNTIAISALSNNPTVIVGGQNNNLTSPGSFIGGGLDNDILASFSTIGGGQENEVHSTNSFIGGGLSNYISTNAISSSIPGGFSNRALDENSWVGGENMEAANQNQFLWGHHDSAQQTINKPNSFIIYSGKVGIRTLEPQEKLHVNGHTHVSNNLYLTGLNDNNTLNPLKINDTNGLFSVADLAEVFPAKENVEPGDVLSIADGEDDQLQKSQKAYDQKVIGIVSTSPAIIFKGSETVLLPANIENKPTKEPAVALKGRVPVKVTLENGPIKAGDPLTSSSIPGHAMKSTDPERSWGTTIGKALEGFSGGPNGETEGMIIVFVTLH